MPELPEVEIIKLFLAENIVGLTVKSVDVLNPKSFLGDPNLLIGKEIKSIERRAKMLIIKLVNQDRYTSFAMTMLIHLKMSGQLILKGGRAKGEGERFLGGHPTHNRYLEMPDKSTRVVFELENLTLNASGFTLYFNDQRKFGWIRVVTGDKLERDRFFSKLGPEPLEKEFTWQVLKDNLLRRKKTSVKVALLDQQIVAGVGNIYASEACFLAGIDPRIRSGELTDNQIKNLHKGIVKSLQNGIKYGGSSKTHFTNPEGKKGLFLDYAFVYGREKLPCKKCRTPIKKIKLGKRGTFFCPECQPFDSTQGMVD